MKYSDLDLHTRGQARFVDDLPEPEGLLHAVVLTSPAAHGRITRLDTGKAVETDGVHGVLTADDIPGANEIGTLVADEPLLADDTVHFIGQPVALILADSKRQDREALPRIDLEIDELPAIVDPREAKARES